MCHPHRCRCGSSILPDGQHPLSCRNSAGRFPRHAAINDITKRAMDAASFHPVWKPVGIDCDDSRRPAGIAVFTFRQCKALVRDAMCSDTFALSNIFASATNPACIAAEVRKLLKYANLTQDNLFDPVVVETSGLIRPDASSLFHEIGCKISRDRDDPVRHLFYFNASQWPSSGEMHSQS